MKPDALTFFCERLRRQGRAIVCIADAIENLEDVESAMAVVGASTILYEDLAKKERAKKAKGE